MSQEWNIRSRGHVCTICQKPLVDKTPVVSALRETPGAASTHLLAPRTLQLLYSSLHVLPDGTPAALLLTEAER